MAEGTLLPNLSWLNSSESRALANSFSTSFRVGVNLIGVERTDRDDDIFRGVAFANANARADATALATTEDDFIAFAFAGADADASASSFAVGLTNRNKIKTARGKDVFAGISFANSLAAANANAESAAVSDFGLAVAIANNRATAYANAFSVGIHNGNRAVIKTKSGGDTIRGQAFANANASAVTQTTAYIAGVIASSQAEVRNINVTTSLTVLGINNNGAIKTGNGVDLIQGVAIGKGTAWAEAATTMAIAIADAVGSANVSATVSAQLSTIAIGLNNDGSGKRKGQIMAGSGRDRVVGIGISDSSSAVATASATAQARGRSSTSNTVTFTTVQAAPNESIGINNIDGLIDMGRGRDTVEAYGRTYGLVGGTVELGRGDDVLQAGIIDRYNSRGTVESFAADQTGALENVDVFGGEGDDNFILHSIFGKNVTLNGDEGFDQLELAGNIDQYTIRVGSIANQTLIISRDRFSMTVQEIEQIHIGNQVFNFTDFQV